MNNCILILMNNFNTGRSPLMRSDIISIQTDMLRIEIILMFAQAQRKRGLN